MSKLIEHLNNEWKAAGWDNSDDEMQAQVYQNLKELLGVFSQQGHSGFSAPYVLNLFAKLARFEPITPLTGADEEWDEVRPGVYQNNRCSHVFKGDPHFNGEAYDIRGRVFQCEDGSCYTSAESAVQITFPYTPQTAYVPVAQ